ncbi:S9 family peptidase [uncultured Stenotrophomonas sp.]|uniref:alpha/beta hydrolase family protein n=1 Tax=uncultured Stenotrophomonas sp. TaxID=165438 RepID=UPI0025D8013A|nr:S9 family peptidase [uncultured Stenotrophomonas sp.]
MKQVMYALFLAMLTMAGVAHAEVDLGGFIRKDYFGDLKLSPSGEFYAATVPMEDRTALVIFKREGNKTMGNFKPAKNSYVTGFQWVNDDRLLVSLSEKFGLLDQPQPTGELYAVNADGSQPELLVGFRATGRGVGVRTSANSGEYSAAFLSDSLQADDRNVIISVWPMTSGNDPFTRAEKLDVYSGRRTVVARAPIRRASFMTDNAGVVRMTFGAGADNVSKLYYRESSSAEWRLVNDEAVTGRVESPIGFSEDNRLAYLVVENLTGPNSILAWNPVSGSREEVLRDKTADPQRIIYRPGTDIAVGALFMDGRHKTVFFDDASPDARMYRSLEAAMGGEAVFITSSTRDGRQLLLQTWSGSNPGEFFLYDSVAKKASHLLTRSDWVDAEKAATVEPFSFAARDGMQLHGYLTKPRGASGRLPMVVMPHGGPFGVYDQWGYDRDSQMLASAGYAVLQVNFRGSGNYGRAYQRAGARQWGGTMQDDVTDATRWAIDNGHSDSRRICIYGASYGAYAALMGVAKEPSLYQCAVGYVGVYDLPIMYTSGDIQERRSGEGFISEWIGERETLEKVSPVNLASQIKVPVFLAAGGKDERAPILHSRRMESALNKAGVPVQTLYFDTEGHGFYTESHQREYYGRLLGFLSQHLGGEKAK